MIEVTITGTFESWQHAARDLLRRGVAPDEVAWIDAAGSSASASEQTSDETSRFVVPRRFVALAQTAAAHPDSGRWATMYRVLWRLVHENRGLLDLADDADVRALAVLQHRQQRIPGFELEPPPPVAKSLEELASAAAICTRCDLYKNATQTVFGRGPSTTSLMLVGEQPGDQEDLQGAPFVGPAGEVLDRALAEIGLDRRGVYITNIVKHFKWEPRGKRRIHMTPRANEIQACRPWLEAELAVVKPRVIVCLGSTAAQALIGPQFRITRSRGQFYPSRWAPWIMATYHPSAVLRA